MLQARGEGEGERAREIGPHVSLRARCVELVPGVVPSSRADARLLFFSPAVCPPEPVRHVEQQRCAGRSGVDAG
jgi:hypothetical protein